MENLIDEEFAKRIGDKPEACAKIRRHKTQRSLLYDGLARTLPVLAATKSVIFTTKELEITDLRTLRYFRNCVVYAIRKRLPKQRVVVDRIDEKIRIYLK